MDVAVRTSPGESDIKKAEAQLRGEKNHINETVRELKFLQEGGNPLDFQTANIAAAISQPTSLTNQHPNQTVTNEAKLVRSSQAESRRNVKGSEDSAAYPLCAHKKWCRSNCDTVCLNSANVFQSSGVSPNLLGHNANSVSNTRIRKPQGSVDVTVCELPGSSISRRCSTAGLLSCKASRKRAAQDTLPIKKRRKSHWDFVLEEMAWMANDFAQERLWKVSAASQLCQKAAVASCSKFEEQHHHENLKKVAYTTSRKFHGEKIRESDMLPEVGIELDKGCQGKKSTIPVQGYAMRFLKYNSCPMYDQRVEAPRTTDSTADLEMSETAGKDQRPTEESLFYTIPSGVVEKYLKFYAIQSLTANLNALNSEGKNDGLLWKQYAFSQLMQCYMQFRWGNESVEYRNGDQLILLPLTQ